MNDAATHNPAPPPRGSLFRKYVALFVAVVLVALLANGAFEIWFSYRDHEASLIRIQREQAAAAAAKIGQFITEIQSQIGWTTELPWSGATLDQRRFDALRLLRQVPAITELAQLDATGKEQLRVSRLEMDVVGAGTDLSHDPRFTEAEAHKVYYGPVYFRRQSEPYMTLALAGTRKDAGVSVAEVNLKFIWDVVSQIKVGEHGQAYVIDGEGRLIAHPDISLVLRNTNLARLAQVEDARRNLAGTPTQAVEIARDVTGREVLTAHAAIAPLDWLVFVELPLDEAYAPLYGSIERAGALLAACLVLAFLAGLFLARRMVGPIRAMRLGAARIASGDLAQRISIKTGDELEALADQFNDMAGALQESYAGLERKVEARTAELTETLAQQTATSEVLRVISSSPGELRPVFEAMLENAVRLCEATQGALYRVEDGVFYLEASREPAELVRWAAGGWRPPPDSSPGRALTTRKTAHTHDVAALASQASSAAVELGGIRTSLCVPMVKDQDVVGAFTLHRREVRPFTDKEIELVENFAAQAVIAIENARLLTELRDSLARQTATAEVLRVINSSPGDLTPVFESILDKAHALCGATRGTLFLRDGARFRGTAVQGYPEELAERLRQGVDASETSMLAPLLAGERLVHIHDLSQSDDPFGRAVAERGGVRTNLLVPLRKDGALLGVISCNRHEVRPFSEKEIALLENFAAQAVIAIENARLLTELRDSLEQQTATADILRVIAGTPGDPTRALAAISETALRMFKASSAAIARVDGQVLRPVSIAGDAVIAFRDLMPEIPLEGTNYFGRCVLENRQIDVPDMSQADGMSEIGRIARRLGVRAAALTPLSRDGETIGVMVVNRTEIQPFQAKELELMTGFADQAVIAIENARLLTELRARTDELAHSVSELRALGEVTQVVNSTLDLPTVLTAIVTHSVRLSATDAGAIYVFDEARQEFRLRATHGMDASLIAALERQNIGLGISGLGEAAARRAAVQIADLSKEPANPVTDIILNAGFRALLVMPLLRPDHIVGALVVRRRAPGAFARSTIDLLQTFAAQSVVAIQNAGLFSEIEEKGRELAIASQHKSQFLANMSHELRTPLNAILGYTELILDDIYGATAPRQREVLERVQTNGRHLLGLINDVLDLSKIEAGQLALALAPYSIADLVQGVYAAVEPLASAKGLALRLDLPAGLPPCRGDERRLSQVLLNLVGNAIKFTDAGEVVMSARAGAGSLIVAVRDTGPGIALADQAKIFEEFQQADNSSTRAKGGTGLGLAISRRIVAMHGGRLWVDSTQGAGSTFSFSLPLTVERQTEHA